MRRIQRWERKAGSVLLLGLVGALSACESLLEVELPHLLTDAAIEGPNSAETQVNSAIALFECGYTAFGLMGLGAEDAMESIAGVYSAGHVYDHTPDTGTCDTGDTNDNWFDQIMGTRAVISTDPAKFVGLSGSEGAGQGVYDRIQGEWELGPRGERLSAIAAIYMGMSLSHMGEFLCEAALDGSAPLSPPDVLAMAEDWITNRALVHIRNTGDFAMPHGIAPSAEQMALAVRSRIRWARHDLSGAAADASAVLAAQPTFRAWITRDAGETRRNKIYLNATAIGFSAMLGVNDHWRPGDRTNPATGQPWPNPIPHTGYIFLGILPDGRTLEAGNIPVRWAEERRDGNEDPIPLNNTAVPDTRVSHFYKQINGPGKWEVPARYRSDSDDIPYMTWEELTLIQADHELHQNSNPAGAIALVNKLRTAHGLPTISGAYLASLTDGANDRNEVRHLLLEERRREFFAEGARYWSTKIQNTDVLWFPRGQGTTPGPSQYQLLGAVRQLFEDNEYELNDDWVAAGGLALRATGCTGLGSVGGGPGSQQPIVF